MSSLALLKLISSLFFFLFGGLSLFYLSKLKKIEEENPHWLYFQIIITTLIIFLSLYSLNLIIESLSSFISSKILPYLSSFIYALYIFYLIFVSILAFYHQKIKKIYQAIELEKVKSEFVAKVSHELRTPLTSIKGATRLLLGEFYHLDERQDKLMEIIRHNTERLIRLVDDLLDLSKIKSGKIELVLEPISLTDIVEKAIQNLTSEAEKKHITLNMDTMKRMPNMFLDRDRMEQVLNNLIENAIKYTPKGGCINVNLEDKGNDVVCTISDTGVGIPPQDIGKIFNEFHRSSKSLLHKSESGTGLGLPISKGIIRAHRGKIWVESVVGKGSKFIFSLPKEKREKRRRGPLELTPSEKLKAGMLPKSLILVSNEDPEVVNKIKNALEKEDYEVIKAYSGGETLRKAKEYRPNLIILDLLLPDKNGIVVLNKLKSHSKISNIPVIFTTIFQDYNQDIRMGVIDYIKKPFIKEKVFNMIHKLLQNIEPKERKMLILSKDEDIIKEFKSLNLEKIYTAESNKRGFKIAEKENPNLLILDIDLEKEEELELLRAFKRLSIPLLLITNKEIITDIKTQIFRLDLSFDFKKSFSPKLIVDRVNSLLKEDIKI